MSFPRNNNLEWLRLFFAIQVVLVHAGEHLSMPMPRFVEHFPGVPAFFFVSGFLIYASYKNAPGRQYFENRFLRLFPALFTVALGGVAVALIAHGWRDLFANLPTYVIWFISQITIGQAYNPGLFRDIGVGVINGSLWTLTTEILFYLCVPIIVWLEGRFKFAVVALTLLSFIFYAFGPGLLDQPLYREKTVYDAIALTPLAWGWMFGLGILAVKHFDRLQPFLNWAPGAVLPMVLMALFHGTGPLVGSVGNHLGFLYFVCYVALVLWFAFATPHIGLSVDLSYGVYIWHMPIINLLLVQGVEDRAVAFALALLLTVGAAALSWILIEKPTLKLKRKSLKPVTAGPGTPVEAGPP